MSVWFGSRVFQGVVTVWRKTVLHVCGFGPFRLTLIFISVFSLMRFTWGFYHIFIYPSFEIMQNFVRHIQNRFNSSIQTCAWKPLLASRYFLSVFVSTTSDVNYLSLAWSNFHVSKCEFFRGRLRLRIFQLIVLFVCYITTIQLYRFNFRLTDFNLHRS